MNFDLFYLFRYLLCLACGIYSLVRICQGLWRWRRWLWADDRTSGLLRGYVLAQFLRLRFRRYSPDILQIVFLIGVLWHVILLHRRI